MNNQKPKFFMICGIPGSGKSTKAKELIQQYPDACHFEADMYFTNKDGDYNFDPKKLCHAHIWCQKSAFDAMKEGKTVIVSNTFVFKEHRMPYIKKAEELGYDVEVLVMKGNYQNVHNVPDFVVERMKNQFEE